MKTPPLNQLFNTSPPLLMQSKHVVDFKNILLHHVHRTFNGYDSPLWQKANYTDHVCSLQIESRKTNIVKYSPVNLGKKEENCDRWWSPGAVLQMSPGISISSCTHIYIYTPISIAKSFLISYGNDKFYSSLYPLFKLRSNWCKIGAKTICTGCPKKSDFQYATEAQKS